jgi:hypothetical protein
MQRIWQFLSPRKHDVATEATLSSERHRRALLTNATDFAAHAISLGASLITIPFILHYLGNERIKESLHKFCIHGLID